MRPALRRDGDGRGRVVLTVVTAILVVAAWTGLLLWQFAWRPQWLLVAASLAHYLMWFAPVGLVLAAVNRRHLTTAAAGVATVLALIVQFPPTLAGNDLPQDEGGLTVLQANLKVGGADPAALVRMVRDHDVDLLATEELTDAAATRLIAAGLPKLLPYRYLRPLPGGGSGSGIWSRWPLSGRQDLPGFYLGTVRARVTTPDGPLTFVAVHLTPPWPFPVRRWLDETTRLRAFLSKQPTDGPVIAAGDYNATVDHAQFRDLITGGYRDAADDAGAGYLPSYPNDRWYGPVIGIDHVLLRKLVGATAETLELPGSDHRALLVTTGAQ